MSYFGAVVSGDTLDYKEGSLLVGYYQGENALEILDMKMMMLRETIGWDNLTSGNKGHFHIYSSQFLNKEDAVLAGSWRINDLRLFRKKEKGRSLIISKANPIHWILTSRTWLPECFVRPFRRKMTG